MRKIKLNKDIEVTVDVVKYVLDLHKEEARRINKLKDYYNNNQWFKSSKTVPRVNSIISWSKGKYGHVAYVEAVDAKTGDIWISHAGGGNSWYGITKLTKSSGYAPASLSGTWSGYTLNGFVYLDQPK